MADDSKVRTARFENAADGSPAHGNEGRPAGDPLAELARLIGQDDLFDQMRKDAARAEMRVAPPLADEPGPAPEWLSRPRRAAEELRGSYDDVTGHAPASHSGAIHYPHGDPLGHVYGQAARANADADDDQAPTGAEADEPDPRYADAPGPYEAAHDRQAGYGQSYAGMQEDAGNYESDPYASETPYDEAYEEPPHQRRRSGLVVVAAVLGLAAVGTAGALGYRAFTGSGGATQPPVIEADGRPAKVVPTPQGTDAQGGKLIYDRADKPQSEKVVSREEQPIEMKDAKPAGPKMVTTSTISATGASGTPSQSAMAYAPASPAPGAAATEPKKVRTFAIRPDGSTDAAASRPPAATPSTRIAAASPQAADAARAPAGAPTRTASIPGNTPSVSAAGAYVVQLVSNRSEAEAQSSFKDLQAKYPGVLGNRAALIRRVELGDRGTYYRAQVGPFASAEQANTLCDNLKAAGGTCIVHRNVP